jgi:hypothetical protein
VVNINSASTTTRWLFLASPGALRLRPLPRFGLKALYRNPQRSTVKYGTCLKIMVSPVRFRVSPLLKVLQNAGKGEGPILRRGPSPATVLQPILGKHRVHLLRGLSLHTKQHVRISVQGDRNAGVAQKFLHHLGMDSPTKHERRAGVTEIVETDLG